MRQKRKSIAVQLISSGIAELTGDKI